MSALHLLYSFQETNNESVYCLDCIVTVENVTVRYLGSVGTQYGHMVSSEFDFAGK